MDRKIKLETHTLIESFTSLEDACHFLDQKILEAIAEGWDVKNGSGIERIGLKWRVGVMMSKGELKGE